MNRPIKFRVIDIEEKQWIPIEDFDDPISVITGGSDRYRRFIAMQFTGLLDKNGKEIYEGDILRHDFSPGRTETIVCCDENIIALIMKLRNYRNMRDLNDRFEVIGNIYENPELLAEREKPENNIDS